MVSTERPRLSVRPLSDARFESVKDLLSVDDDMRQVMQASTTPHTTRRGQNAQCDRVDGSPLPSSVGFVAAAHELPDSASAT